MRKDIAELVSAVEVAQREAQRAVQSAQQEAERASQASTGGARASGARAGATSAPRASPLPLTTPPFLSTAFSPGAMGELTGGSTLSGARAQPRHWHSLLAST